ncbi:hypothetical protein EVAR_45326_1 [Eumeta japonica]|uniref:Uncharacterized protein n=1 Tax=Eumeta variegata TaxID=151549 RepID=A0A4C1XLF0_EUMVA|nr:hypothetical protein EVAR_45326_1 [Eumeta japonica]
MAHSLLNHPIPAPSDALFLLKRLRQGTGDSSEISIVVRVWDEAGSSVRVCRTVVSELVVVSDLILYSLQTSAAALPAWT